jgi:2-succinyl-6-hydroxy-2,4-cyclohexadiene-1-carboxylate synthase
VPLLELQDASINYQVEGEGPPVTLLHGFTQDLHSWDELISLLPRRWRWIRVDLRGHGGSRLLPGAQVTMDSCHADLTSLWRRLGVRETHLVGYSLGGRLALHVASRDTLPLLSLTTIGAHAGMDEADRPARRAADEALARRLESEPIEWFVDYWAGLPMFAGQRRRGDEFVGWVRRQRLQNDPTGLAACLRGMGGGAMEPVWSRLPQVSCRGLFIAGALDSRYVDYARQLAAAVPHGREAIVDDAGHAVHLEQPAAVALLLADHLSTR